MEPLISVIIPAYNVEKYLERCLNSVIRQTYRNIEILLIDDGSTDQTGAICDRYADLDGRITVMHKDNSGQADCRNIAFQASSGEMICYVDSDDLIAEDYLEYLYQLLMKYGGDISMCGYRKFSDKRAIRTEGIDAGSHVQSMSGEEALESLLYQREVMTSPWAKLFHKKILEGILFPVGRLYEDLGMVYKTLVRAQKVIYGSAQKYYYYQRQGSTMQKRFEPRKMDRVYFAGDIRSAAVISFPGLVQAADCRFFVANFQTLKEIPMSGGFPNEYKEICKNIKLYRKRVLYDRKAKKSARILACLSYLPMRVFHLVSIMYDKAVNRM